MGRHGWGLSRKGRYSPATDQRVRDLITTTGTWRPPPEFVERLMGFPDGWTDLTSPAAVGPETTSPGSPAWATPSSPPSANTSDDSSSPESTTTPEGTTMARPDNVRPLRTDRADPFAAAWTADALMNTTFPEPKWAVPGVIAEGVTVFAGPPKVGKSWASLGLALAIAAGRDAFDRIPVRPGPVLYLALEDTPRRLQRRMRMLLRGEPAPAGLTLLTTFPALNQGGDTAIAGWLDRNPDARLVVIDVFAKIRGTAAPGLSAYDADYSAVGRIKKVADHYGVAVILVHHVRKAANEDFLQEVSGTNGIAGAADATIVLKRARNEADGVLSITGRDVEEAEHALTFDSTTGAWQMLDGPATDHTLSTTRAAILRHLREHPGATPRTLAAPLDLSHDNARRTCARMADDGQLTTDGTGRYYAPLPGGTANLPGAVPPVPPVPPHLFPQVGDPNEVGQPSGGAVPPVPAGRVTEEEQ
jgi:hypothetical protein